MAQLKFISIALDSDGSVIALDDNGRLWREEMNEDKREMEWQIFAELPTDDGEDNE